jgi:hypothetical protein
MFSEEQLLKLQYSIIGQKLQTIKIKKELKRRRELLFHNVEKTTPEQLHKKIDNLIKTIDAGDWKGENEAMNAEKKRLIECKRKLEDRLDEEFLEERQSLREERRKLQEERKKFQEEKEAFERRRRPTAVVAGTVDDTIIIENDD